MSVYDILWIQIHAEIKTFTFNLLEMISTTYFHTFWTEMICQSNGLH